MNYYPNNPAWTNIYQTSSSLYEINKENSSILFNKYVNSKLYKIIRNNSFENVLNNPTGHYYLYDNKPLFLKVIDKKDFNRINMSNNLLKELYLNGVDVLMPIDKYPRKLGEEHYIFAYEYIDSRFANNNFLDITEIAKSLKKLHFELRKIKYTDIEENTEKREKDFYNNIYNSKETFFSLSDNIQDILSKNRYLFNVNFGDKTVTHGDLNYHNIIFDKNSDKLFILDFEDYQYAFFPIIIDIAMIIERFILLRDISLKEKIDLVNNFFENYIIDSSLKLKLQDAIKFISMRSILILLNVQIYNKKLNESELSKFLDHLNALEENSIVFDKINYQ